MATKRVLTKERRAYSVIAVTKRRKKVRLMAVEYKGGCCSVCGYSKCIGALEFHHTDPTKKDFAISAKGHTRSWSAVVAELDKCVILCANCHRETHESIRRKG